MSVMEVQELSKPWDIYDARSQCMHTGINEMLSVDCQPLSMVEDLGFKSVLQIWNLATNVQVVLLYLKFILARKRNF